MTKLLKIIGSFVGITLEWLLIFVILFTFLIRTSPVQTFIAQIATDYLSDKLEVKVSIEGVAVIFPNEIALHGVFMEDEYSDTLIACRSLYLDVTSYNFNTKTFKIGEVEVDHGFTHLKKFQNGDNNFSFIGGKFSSDTTKKSNVNFDIIAREIRLIETTFIYDDERETPTNFGVDYFHIRGDHINAKIDEIEVSKYDYKAYIKSFSLIEKSGFQLSSLKSHARVSHDGIELIELSIKSPGSSIYAPRFNMLTEEFSDMLSFVDNVKFDAQLNKSSVSLSEVAFFAPILEGMNDTIQISGIVSKIIPEMRLSNFKVKYKEKTQITGTLNLPDYRDFKTAFLQEKIKYAYIDLNELQSLKMPKTFNGEYISLDENTNKLSFFAANDIRFDGFFSEFVLAADRISTQLGSVRMNNGLMFSENKKDGSFDFQRSTASDYDLKVEQFDLGQFLGNKQLGVVDGYLFVSGRAFSSSNLEFSSIEGKVNRFDFMDYSYSNITISDSKMMDNSFDGNITIDDPNICMNYGGIVDFKNDLHFDFYAEIDHAQLDKLNLSPTTPTETVFSSIINVDMVGTGMNTFIGSVELTQLFLDEKEEGKLKTLEVPSLKFSIDRSEKEDLFAITSDILDAEIKGKVDFYQLMEDFQFQFEKILPSLIELDAKNYEDNTTDNFTFSFNVKDAKKTLDIFMPSLDVAKNTLFTGEYSEENKDFYFNLTSNEIKYNDFVFKGIDLNQKMNQDSLQGFLELSEFQINDSTSFSNVTYLDNAKNDDVESILSWGKDSAQISNLLWNSHINAWNSIDFYIQPSNFKVKDFEWSIIEDAGISLRSDTIKVMDLGLSRGLQKIFLEGQLSKSNQDILLFEVEKIDLNEVSSLLQIAELDGITDAQGEISNPFENFQFIGKAKVTDLYVLKELVGDVSLDSRWVKENQSIELNGDLNYRKMKTFNFTGEYFTRKEKENLDFFLDFDNTDISFTNAFMNPEVVSGISGHLKGKVKVSGTPDHPKLNGMVNLLKGSAKIEMLGTSFSLDGPIEIDESGFYINSLPLFDEDGNAGSVVGAVFHENFNNFNFDIQIDVEEDAINKDLLKPWVPLKLEQFLVLNTVYEIDAAYYGKAYATGTVNLFGYSDNLEITVDLKTSKNTVVSIPMYGVSEIEDENFIVFVGENKDSIKIENDPKIDFTGVDLDLNFKVTPEATVKIVFDENIEDEIVANGKGDININLNSLGDITMDGLYTVTNGVYDFTLGPVKKKFYIEEGGNISWSGDPYNALLDLKTFIRVNANIATLTNNQLGQGSGSRQPILCYLDLSKSLVKPEISFDIQAPNAGDISQSLITRIKNDPDELNRQFFSLLLWNRFQPLTGTSSQDGSAALELVANQLNSLLSKMSNDYTMNVNLNKDQLTGGNSYEFGVKKGFLDDKLILSGSFGVENQKVNKDVNKSTLIGDVRLEYIINDQGTFRVNVFNVSNDRTVINSQYQGSYTQGVGLTYQESFNTVDDFKIIQKILDLFRKEDEKRFPKKQKLEPVPKENQTENNKEPVKT